MPIDANRCQLKPIELTPMMPIDVNAYLAQNVLLMSRRILHQNVPEFQREFLVGTLLDG